MRGVGVSKNVLYILSNGQNSPLPLPPLLLLLLQLTCGIGEEHHIFFVLDLLLEELEGGAVKAQHILK